MKNYFSISLSYNLPCDGSSAILGDGVGILAFSAITVEANFEDGKGRLAFAPIKIEPDVVDGAGLFEFVAAVTLVDGSGAVIVVDADFPIISIVTALTTEAGIFDGGWTLAFTAITTEANFDGGAGGGAGLLEFVGPHLRLPT